MTIRGIIWVVLLAAGATLSAIVTLRGVWALMATDLNQDTLLTLVYCGTAMLCFPVFFLVRPQRRSAILLSLMALTYLGAYTALNWRTCAELGYCESLSVTIMQTLSTNVVLAFFAVVILSLSALLVDDRTSIWNTRA